MDDPDESHQPGRKKRKISTMLPPRRCTGQKDFFSHLPNEVIVKILSYLGHYKLTRCARVSHHVHKLCMSPSLWRVVKLPLRLHHEKALQVIRRCTQLRDLDLTPIWYDDRAASLAVSALELCPQLHTLRMNNPTVEVFHAIEKQSSQSLRCLHMEKYEDYKKEMFVNIPGCLKNLTTLNLGDNYYMMDKQLRTVADQCRNLESFVCEMGVYRQEAVNYFLEAVKASIKHLGIDVSPPGDPLRNINMCQLLERLDISGHGITSAALDSLALLPRLVQLSIGAFGRRRDDFLQAFHDRKLARLTTLKINFMDVLDDEAVVVIIDNCPSLAKLTLYACGDKVTDEGMRYIMENSANLRHLDLAALEGITKGMLRYLPTSSLLTMEVSGCDITGQRDLAEEGKSWFDWMVVGYTYSCLTDSEEFDVEEHLPP